MADFPGRLLAVLEGDAQPDGQSHSMHKIAGLILMLKQIADLLGCPFEDHPPKANTCPVHDLPGRTDLGNDLHPGMLASVGHPSTEQILCT